MPAHSAFWKRLGYAFISLSLALAALSPLTGATPVAHASGSYVVDAILDAPDVANNGICSDGVGDCTLRAAIQQASEDVGPTTITFSNALAGQTFTLDNTYGALLWTGDNITVTGGSNNITISGAALSAGKSIFTIEGDHNLLEHLTVTHAPQDGVQVGDFAGVGKGNFNDILAVNSFDNGAAGVYVYGSSDGGQLNVIQASTIGSPFVPACGSGNNVGVFVDQSATGTIVQTNMIICNTQQGVKILNAGSVTILENRIGLFGNTQLANGGAGIFGSGTIYLNLSSNWIGGNGSDGILLQNSQQALVQSNLIGTDESGSAILANGGNGVQLAADSNRITIGGLTPALRNIISGNGQAGVLLDGGGVQSNTVVGNYIGTNISGTAALANSQNGVRLQNSAHNNTIGGFGSTTVRNVISGNTLDGVLFTGGATLNYVDGSFIGLAASGLSALPNSLGGVAAINAPGNNIGSSWADTAQYISGNQLEGIFIQNSDSTTIGQTNHIGTAPNGLTPAGNGSTGVAILQSNDTWVTPAEIAYNGGAGVAVTGSPATGNDIYPGFVALNGGLPIDLGDDGPTANDPGDTDSGPNTLLNYPVITSSAGHLITGTVCANCTVNIYQAIGNPALPGGGGIRIGSTTANGAGQWSATLPVTLTRPTISLNACQLPCFFTGNSSEMSPRPILFLPTVRR